MKKTWIRFAAVFTATMLFFTACGKGDTTDRTKTDKNDNDITQAVTPKPTDTQPQPTAAEDDVPGGPDTVIDDVTGEDIPVIPTTPASNSFTADTVSDSAYYYWDGQLNYTTNLSDMYDMDTLMGISSFSYPTLSTSSAEAFPEFAKAYDSYIAKLKSNKNTSEETLKTWADSLVAAGQFYGYRTDEFVSKVVRADSSIVSFAERRVNYSANNDVFLHFGTTFDVRTGKCLSFADTLAGSLEDSLDSLVEYILASTPEDGDWLTPFFAADTLSSNNTCFYLGYDAAVLYFNCVTEEYEDSHIDSAAVLLPYSEFGALFRPEYVTPDNDYVAQFSDAIPIYVEDPHSGRLVQLYTTNYSEVNDNGDENAAISIYWGNTCRDITDLDCTAIDNRYMHLDGQDYVFVYSLDEQNKDVRVFKLDRTADNYVSLLGSYKGDFAATPDIVTAKQILASPLFKVSEKPELITVYTGSSQESLWNDSYTQVLCRSQTPIIWLSDEDSLKYPKLAAMFEGFNAVNTEAATENNKELENLALEAVDADYDFFGPYQAEYTYNVKRADSSVVSFLETGDYYSGGVHPLPVYKPYNFDPMTGESITLHKVIKDIDGAAAKVSSLIKAEYGEYLYDTEGLDSQMQTAFEGEELLYLIGCEGVTFYFPPYELAPYSAGLIQATLFYEIDPEFFYEKYTIVPESYMYAVETYDDFEVTDSTGNASVSYSIVVIPDEYGSMQSLQVYSDELLATIDIYSTYELHPYVLRTAFGSLYLLLDMTGDSDDSSLRVIALYDDYAWDCGIIDNMAGIYSPGKDYNDRYYSTDNTIYRPSHILLESRLDMLGTTFECAEYDISADPSMPNIISWDYSYMHSPALTLNTDLVFERLNGNVPTGEKVTLPAGTELSMAATDGQTYITFYVEDSKYRLYLDENTEDSWYFSVNGAPVYTLFEGVSFAD